MPLRLLQAVFQSPANNVKKHAVGKKLDYPLICDPDGIIRTAHYGSHLADHLPLRLIFDGMSDLTANPSQASQQI